VLTASEPLRGRPPLVSRWPGSGTLRTTVRIGAAGERTDYAVVALRVSDTLAVYAASSLEPVNDGVAAAAGALGVVVPVLLLAVAGVAWVLVGRVLRPVEESHERQRRFVADASHELRSPLAAIRTRLEVSLAHPAGTDWVPLAQAVHREGLRMQHLVDDLLLLSRGAPLPAQPVDLDELVLQEVEEVRARGKVTVALTPFSAARVPGRPGELRRVVRNLLDNAERHAQNAVVVGLSTQDGTAELVVTDDGDGIPPAYREQVFERFFRLQGARDRDSGGAGLGLAIVREIVAGHGGRTWLAETPTGAEFHVTLRMGS
jgi:signal transduction histidine kinase